MRIKINQFSKYQSSSNYKIIARKVCHVRNIPFGIFVQVLPGPSDKTQGAYLDIYMERKPTYRVLDNESVKFLICFNFLSFFKHNEKGIISNLVNLNHF